MDEKIATRECHECGVRRPQPEMNRMRIRLETGSSSRSLSKREIFFGAAGSAAAQKSISRWLTAPNKRTYYRIQDVWKCNECAGVKLKNKTPLKPFVSWRFIGYCGGFMVLAGAINLILPTPPRIVDVKPTLSSEVAVRTLTGIQACRPKSGTIMEVVHVPIDDVLNIRKSANPNAEIVATALPSSRSLVFSDGVVALSTDCERACASNDDSKIRTCLARSKIWYFVRLEGQAGWASATYLSETSDD